MWTCVLVGLPKKSNISVETMDVLSYKRVFVPTYTKPHNKWMSGYNTEKQVPFMHDR